MLSRFPDPHDPCRVDVRLALDADAVTPAVLAAYGLEGASVTRLPTGSFNIHFRVEPKIESKRGTFDLRRSNRPADRGNLLYEAPLRFVRFDSTTSNSTCRNESCLIIDNRYFRGDPRQLLSCRGVCRIIGLPMGECFPT